jgi:hypothetical protein
VRRNEKDEQGFLKEEGNTLLPSLLTSKILAHPSHFFFHWLKKSNHSEK